MPITDHMEAPICALESGVLLGNRNDFNDSSVLEVSRTSVGESINTTSNVVMNPITTKNDENIFLYPRLSQVSLPLY